MNWKQVTTAASVLASLPALAVANCDGIANKADRSLFYSQEGVWKPTKELDDKLGKEEKRVVAFAFVIRDDDVNNRRRGVVVIKSGYTTPKSSSIKEMNRVALRRPWIKDPCRKRPYKLLIGSVTQRSYDDYHDRDLRTSEDGVISKFHIIYDSRKGCRETNDSSPDAYFDQKSRSNRSQFSFDPKVVASGTIRHAWTWSQPNSAQADELVAGRTVQIRKYEADNRGFACVEFRVTVGPGAFVRVNDLESRTLLGTDSAEWVRNK